MTQTYILKRGSQPLLLLWRLGVRLPVRPVCSAMVSAPQWSFCALP
jgi:hypothetical protein